MACRGECRSQTLTGEGCPPEVWLPAGEPFLSRSGSLGAAGVSCRQAAGLGLREGMIFNTALIHLQAEARLIWGPAAFLSSSQERQEYGSISLLFLGYKGVQQTMQ